MEKQIVISIGREYGSAGKEIAVKLGQKFDIPVYDRNILDEVAVSKNADSDNLAKYDERPKRLFFSRSVPVRGVSYSSSPEENIVELQFALLKQKYADGDSFIVVGRCSDELYRGKDNFISIFITADVNEKIKRIEGIRHFNEKQAVKALERHDKKRALYHDRFSKGGKWGQAATYDLCVNSTRLGIDGTVDFIYEYVKTRVKSLS